MLRYFEKKEKLKIEMFSKMLVLFMLMEMSITLIGCGSGKKASAGVNTSDDNKSAGSIEKPRNVRVLILKKGDLKEFHTISGIASPVRGTVLSSEEGGVVVDIPHGKGSFVERDDVLIVLDRRLLKAQLDSAESSRKLAEYNASRIRDLYDHKSVSRLELIQAETALSQAEAQEEIARIRFDRAAIKAPFRGIVSDVFVERGQLVAPGVQVARVIDYATLVLKADVSEQDIQWIRNGAEAEVTFSDENVVYHGVVSWTGVEANSGTGKFKVEIEISNSDLLLKPGIMGRARILSKVCDNAIIIPRDAVIHGDSGNKVFIVENGTAKSRNVTLGSDQGVFVEVKEGLNEGDSLIVRGQRDLRDGSSVAVREFAENFHGGSGEVPNISTASLSSVSDDGREDG